MLVMRLRRQCKHRTGFLIANANGHNWIYNKFIKDGAPQNHRIIQATTLDFADILPEDYITNLKQNLPERLYRRYVLNSHEEAEGLVFNEYQENKHMIDPFSIPETWERGFVLDHGFRNPTGVLWYAIDYDGNIILYDEHYATEKPISEHADIIKLRKLTDGWADPSIFSMTQQRAGHVYSIADEYREFGITLRPAQREEEYAAIGRVNEMFKAGRIKVFRTLSNFRMEIAAWKWKLKRPGAVVTNNPEEPEDYMNHLMDCLKYLVQSRFPAADKPKEKPVDNSLSWYEDFTAQVRQEREKNKPLW
jgi:hypothetical protein